MIQEKTARLSAGQVSFYKDEGYLLYDQPVFSEGRFAGLKSRFEGLLAEWTARGVSKSPEHMDVPHFWDPSLFGWLLDDAVLDLVEPLIGPDIVLWSSHFICKPAAVGKRVPWHEDSAYWKGRIDPMEVVTVWLAIDPSLVANGCMRLIPKTQGNGYSQYEEVANPSQTVFSTEIKKEQVDESRAVDCILQPNHCSLHDGRLIHGSNANTGTLRRCGYTMRYMPATVKCRDAGLHQIYLARGKDRGGNTYGDPTKPNAAWMEKYADGQPAGH